jgi:GMP synthase (glutamine-hydrolysing)
MDTVVILDFGSQTTHLISRRIRDAGVYTEVVDGRLGPDEIVTGLPEDRTIRGIVLSGSQHSVYDSAAPRVSPRVLEMGVPVLGICYGFQQLVSIEGGTVARTPVREYGPATIHLDDSGRVGRASEDPLFEGVDDSFISWMSHGDTITALPPAFTATAVSAGGVIAAARRPDASVWGLQFHPEVTHTRFGDAILRNFALSICGCRPSWSIADMAALLSHEVREAVGDRSVLCLVSGGVDSTVLASLLLRSLPPDRVYLLAVDTGLMRKDEIPEVRTALERLGARNLHIADAADTFLADLAGIVDPEEKRRRIGDTFVRVQADHVAGLALPGDYVLAQGTLYTDLVESGHGLGRRSATIKTHHNVGSPLVREKRDAGLLVEPLGRLYKDEVRQIGRHLGLDESVVGRHPFPGPGLAVRILGEVTRERCDVLRSADAVFLRELRERGLYDEIWQAFAVLLPVRAVGVSGDERRYGDVCVLRAVTSVDGMTADAYEFASGVLSEIAARITNEVEQIARVAYDVSSKPPATIEWE